MKNIRLLLFFALPWIMFSCDPSEDRDSLGDLLTPSDLKYSVTQNPEYQNQVYLENQTKGTFPYWDYVLGTSTREMDTIIFPFAGEYDIKFTAFGRAGAAPVATTQITIPENDPLFFADPAWNMITNGVDGKYWVLDRVTLGPASNYESIWGDVGWWSPEAYNWEDSSYFDLAGGFNFKRYHNGTVTSSTFKLDLNEVLTGAIIPDAGQSITILGSNQMNVKDGSNEMAGTNKTRYRIYKLTENSLVVGQGSYYTASRITEDWSYYHWYVPAEE